MKIKHSSLPHHILFLTTFVEEYPVKVTTKDLKHSLTCTVLRVSSQISAEPHSLSLSSPSHIQIPHMVYKLSAKHAFSQGQTSADTGAEPQPGIAHLYRHLAQAAEQQEAVPWIQIHFLWIPLGASLTAMHLHLKTVLFLT